MFLILAKLVLRCTQRNCTALLAKGEGFIVIFFYFVCCTVWCLLCLRNCAALFYVMGIVNLKKKKKNKAFLLWIPQVIFSVLPVFSGFGSMKGMLSSIFPIQIMSYPGCFGSGAVMLTYSRGRKKKKKKNPPTHTHRKTWIFFLVLFPIIWMFLLRL